MKSINLLVASAFVVCALFAPLTSAADANEAQTWSLAGTVNSIAMSGDGIYTLIGGNSNTDSALPELYLFRPDSSTAYQSYNLGAVTDVPTPNALSVGISDTGSQGPYFAAGAGSKVQFFKSTSSTAIASKTLNTTVSSVAMSADGKYIVAGTDAYSTLTAQNSGAVYLFELSSSSVTQKWLHYVETNGVLTSVNDKINSVAISGNGGYIVAGSENKQIYVYTPASNARYWSMGLDSAIIDVAMSRGGSNFAATFGTYVGGYNISTKIGWTASLGSAPTSLSISGDGKLIAVGFGKSIRLLQVASSLPTKWTATMSGNVKSVAISSDGRYVIAGDDAGNVAFFSTEKNEPVWSASTENSVNAVAIDSKGGYASAGGGDSKGHLYAPTYQVAISSTTTQASVNPGASVTYALKVENKGNRYDTYAIGVTDASTNYQWGSLSASAMTLAPGKNGTVNYTIAVPSGTAAASKAIVTIKATSSENSAVSASLTTTTTVSQTYGAQISNVPQSPVLFNQGESKSFSITVKNSGNGQDTIFISASAPDGWEAALDKSNLALAGQDYGIVKMTVKAPSYATEGTTAGITITARPNNNNGDSITAPFNVKISAHPAFGFSLASGQNSTKQINAGQAGVFNFMVSNQGNSAITATMSSSKAEAVFDTNSVILAPGESKQVAMTVSVPQTATEDDSVSVTASVAGLQPITINCFIDVIPAEPEKPKFIPGFELTFLAAALLLAIITRRR
jgi:uncharacterized membrane protein